MAVKEISGFLKFKDSSGDTNLLLPITTKDNVDGIDEIETELASVSEQVTVLQTDFNETIIGLSVDGQKITYIKGDGSVHTFTTQDTDTTYSLGTDETTGLTKLYATTGSAEDGTLTQ